jgi:hypothetical protein
MGAKRVSTLFLKAVIVLITLAVFGWLIIFPQLEGRAANLDLISIYNDPFIIYIYIAFIPFFMSLYQALKLLGQFDKNKISSTSIKTIENIKKYILMFIGLIALAVLYIFILSSQTQDDGAGAMMLGMIIILGSGVVVAAADIVGKELKKRVV